MVPQPAAEDLDALLSGLRYVRHLRGVPSQRWLLPWALERGPGDRDPAWPNEMVSTKRWLFQRSATERFAASYQACGGPRLLGGF